MYHIYIFIYSICIRTHDTGRSFKPILMKFTRLMGVCPWVNPIVFGNNRTYRTTDIGDYPNVIYNIPKVPNLKFYSIFYRHFFDFFLEISLKLNQNFEIFIYLSQHFS